MYQYICENDKTCNWKGDSEQVLWIYGYEFLGISEPKDEHDLELIPVCPKCTPYKLAFEIKLD